MCVLESQASFLAYGRSCPESVDDRGVDFSSQACNSVSSLGVKVSVQIVILAPSDAQARVLESQVSFADGQISVSICGQVYSLFGSGMDFPVSAQSLILCTCYQHLELQRCES